ncbi:MAG: hypothetical protein C4532_16635 [Candidatus Abyssobacteria bacterium SURF_17]|jgi:hypothetical protein|uniref:Uncharacterized protein n=1 Tax=Candidatus Abyssobacteria bacterium SURF_17 TaxID=2093361 RepID=A0A419ERE0_9BACT|nr:MAG: hypothetical protein C4532_16635 [Candidatus Abyssubacteria bacterium SURF_17]
MPQEWAKLRIFIIVPDLAKSMKSRLLKVLGSYLLWALLAIALWTRAYDHIRRYQFSGNPIAMSLISFEQNLRSYNKAKKQGERTYTVIVGPSYAADLGSPFGSFNLGLGAGSSSEMKTIIEDYCRQKDRILYILSILEASSSPGIIRHGLRGGGKGFQGLKNTASRRLSVTRGYLHSKLGMYERDNLIDRVLPPLTASELHNIGLISNRPNIEESRARIIKHMINMIPDTDYQGIDRYIKLSEERQNIRYVLLPVLPSQTVSRDEEFNKKLTSIHYLEERLFDDIHESGLKYVDLSGILSIEDYSDFVHFTDRGRYKIIKYLNKNGCFD